MSWGNLNFRLEAPSQLAERTCPDKSASRKARGSDTKPNDLQQSPRVLLGRPGFSFWPKISVLGDGRRQKPPLNLPFSRA